MIVCLDYQNHSSALLAAVRPTCLPASSRSPQANYAAHQKALAVPMGPRSTSPSINWGLPSPCPLLFHIPFCHLWGKETKGSQSGGWGVPASPSPSPAQRRCSHQKRLLKDDSFYFFFSDLSILEKTGKTKTKKNKKQKKEKKTKIDH